ncbi:MAG TPA: MoaD/ThiS family protein [Thermoplasmata archaeon]|nr:MoaD/ThiS family protein [Thermoplasmata archaeon]
MAPATVRVRLYAGARAAADRSFVDVEVPAGGLSAREIVRRLGSQCPSLVPVLRASRIVRGDVYLTRLSARIRPGEELSVHPPYGGG